VGGLRLGRLGLLYARRVRVAVYTDYAYHRVDGRTFAQRAFALFLARLASHFERVVLIGREDPEPSRARYAIGSDVQFVPLPFYPTLAEPLAVLRKSVQACARFWRVLPEVDCVWLLGPHPLATVFVVLARVRRKRVVLGVRQDQRAYVRSRHPGRRFLLLAGTILHWVWRALASRFPVVAVGPVVAAQYAGAKAVLEVTVSLVDERDVVAPAVALRRSYDSELRALTVGRLEAEKNPLMLPEVMAQLRDSGRRWRLQVCGEGAMRAAVEDRVSELDVEDSVELLGYVPQGERLLSLYRNSHVLLHVSWTEGLPQVLHEAFAAGLPVVATDVGGIRAAVDDAATLVPAGDPQAAASALLAMANDPRLRERRVVAGHSWIREHLMAAEVGRVESFLRSG
jgi:glycosyltransferase involved in cell wall biosynthesis